MPHEIDVAALRARLRMTQRAFADTFGIAFSTLRDWEHERRQPDQTARTYLRVIAANAGAVREALADPVKAADARVRCPVRQAKALDAARPATPAHTLPVAATRATPSPGKVIVRVPRTIEAAERSVARPVSSGIRIRI